MFSGRVIGSVLIPAATLIAEKREIKCRPSELPIYTSDPPREEVKVTERSPPGIVEQQIGNVRRQVVSLTHEVTKLQDRLVDLYDETYNQGEWLINYLGEENNTTPKYGAIAIGGLAGFILGLRGGKFRKLVLTSAGALGMAAICYPKQAAEYSEIAKEEAVRYIRIGYNFYHGVKKDDPPMELPSLPKMPTNVSEVLAMLSSKSSESVIGEKPKAKDSLPTKEVQFLGGLLFDKSSSPDIDPEKVVSKLHELAEKESCYCPDEGSLNPEERKP